MKFSEFFSLQAGNPSGWFGRLVMARIFDRGNAKLNQFMKERLQVEQGQRILEIGCGTGRLLGQLAAAVGSGVVEGVELSETMASLARKVNREAVNAGRVVIHRGDFNEIALQGSAFDAVCSCNTIYFWPEPLATLRKIHSILKPGGKVVIAFEDASRLEAKPISREVFRFYSQDGLRELFAESPFKGELDIREAPGDAPGFCCAVVRK